MNKLIRILIVEDSESDKILIVRHFEQAGYNVYSECVATEAAMDAALSQGKWDAIISDHSMPGFSGLAALRVLQRKGAEIPFIIVSGKMGEDIAVEAMKTGANDYMNKGDLKRLVPAVEQAIRAAENKRELKKMAYALSEAQRLFLEIGKIGKVGGWEVNIDTGKQIWTEETYHIHEIDPTVEPTVEQGINFYTPASRLVIARLFDRAVKYGESYDVDLDIITAKGHLRHVNAIGIADLDHRRVYGFFQDITERKKAQKEMQEQKVLLQGAFDRMSSGLAIYEVKNDGAKGSDYIVKKFNQRSLEIEGKRLDEVVGKSLLDLRPNIDQYGLIPVFQKVWQTGEPGFLPVKIYKDDIFNALYENRVFKLPTGEIVAVYDDVTEGERSRMTLQENEAKFRAMVDTFPLAVHLTTGLEQTTQYMNATMVRLFGYTPEDIPSVAEWYPLAYPDAAYRLGLVEEWTRRVKHAIETQTAIEPMESTVTCKDGSKKDMLWGYMTLGDKNYSYGLDVTHRKQAEEQMKKEQALTHSVIESIPGTFYMLDEHGRYVRWNAFQRDQIVGKSEDQMGTVYAIDTIHPDDRALIQSKIAHVLQHGGIEMVEGRVLMGGGPGFKWLLMTGQQIKIDGRPFLVGIGIDITERKAAEVALQQSQELLTLFIRRSPIYAYIKSVTSAEDRIFQVSDNFEQMLGIPGPKMVGKTMAELFSPEFAAKVTADDWGVVSSGLQVRIDEDFNGRQYTSIKFPIVQGDKTLVAGYTIDVTDEKLAEEALKISNLRLNLALHAAHMGVWQYDIPGDKRIFDDRACALLGIDAARFGGSTEEFFAAVHPDDREVIKVALTCTIDQGAPYRSEYRVIRPDGSIHYVLARGELQRDDQGRPRAINGLIWDVTERRRVEDSLSASELRYRRLFETAKDGVLILDAGTGLIVDVNPYLIKLLGFSKDEFLDKKVWELGCFKDLFANHLKFTQLQQQEYVRYDNLPLRTAGGQNIDAEFVSNVYWVDHRKVIQCNIRDISERRRTEEAKKASEEYLARIIDSVADPIFVKDREHRWVLCNKVFCEFIGHTAEEILGKSDHDFFPRSEADVFWAKDEEVFRSGVENVNEEFFTDSRGDTRTIVTKKNLYKDAAGQDYIVGIIRDITEQQKVEAALRKHAQEMEVFYRASFGREERILELKKKVAELEEKLKK